MVITTTAVAFTLLGFGLGWFGWQFLRAFQKSSTGRTSSLLGIFLSISALQNLVLGLGVLFFVENNEALRIVMAITQFLLSAHAVLGIYVVYYIFFPNKSRFLTLTLVSVLGFAGFILTLAENPRPFITASNGIEWAMSSTLSSLMFAILWISIGSFTYIFFKLYQDSISKRVKSFALILFWAGVAGLGSTFVRFFLFQRNPSDLGRRILDTGMGLAGVIFLIALIVTTRKSRNKSPLKSS